ncbi:MAG: LLM class flavin-dependent oxidoreductase [Pseudomonadota bacterium]
MPKAKFGLFILPPDITVAQQAAKQAEKDGFFSISHNDHFYSPLGSPESPQLECFTVLTAMAAVTKTIRLAPAVAVPAFREPALFTKIACSLDSASNGRFICGLGAGWYDKEYLAHGYAFPPLEERLDRLNEYLSVYKTMCTEDAPAYEGRYYKVTNAFNNPRPVQKPFPPIMLGGSATGLLKIAAQHADIINMIPPTSNGKDFVNDPQATVRYTMDKLKSRITELKDLCEAEGRARDAIELGGLCLVGLSEDSNDSALRDMASGLGFPDYSAAQASPVALLGTPAEVKEELAARVAQTGVVYYIVVTPDERSYRLFVEEVMPAFS